MSEIASFLISHTLFGLSILTYVPVESLVVFHILFQFQFHVHLGFADLISACLWSIPLFFPGHTSIPLSVHVPSTGFHCLCISFLSLSLISRSLISHVSYLSSLLVFLHIGRETSFALRKASLKSCQFCFALLSLRTAFHGTSSSNFLHSLKFAFLKFRILTLLFTRPIFLKITKSARLQRPYSPECHFIVPYVIVACLLKVGNCPALVSSPYRDFRQGCQHMLVQNASYSSSLIPRCFSDWEFCLTDWCSVSASLFGQLQLGETRRK